MLTLCTDVSQIASTPTLDELAGDAGHVSAFPSSFTDTNTSEADEIEHYQAYLIDSARNAAASILAEDPIRTVPSEKLHAERRKLMDALRKSWSLDGTFTADDATRAQRVRNELYRRQIERGNGVYETVNPLASMIRASTYKATAEDRTSFACPIRFSVIPERGTHSPSLAIASPTTGREILIPLSAWWESPAVLLIYKAIRQLEHGADTADFSVMELKALAAVKVETALVKHWDRASRTPFLMVEALQSVELSPDHPFSQFDAAVMAGFGVDDETTDADRFE